MPPRFRPLSRMQEAEHCSLIQYRCPSSHKLLTTPATAPTSFFSTTTTRAAPQKHHHNKNESWTHTQSNRSNSKRVRYANRLCRYAISVSKTRSRCAAPEAEAWVGTQVDQPCFRALTEAYISSTAGFMVEVGTVAGLWVDLEEGMVAEGL